MAVKIFFGKSEIALIGQENLALRRLRKLPVSGKSVREADWEGLTSRSKMIPSPRRPRVEQRFRQSTGNRPFPGDFGFAGSDAECALVGEKRRRAACVQEDDILVLVPTPLADQGDQAREPLARIDRIKW